MATFGNPAIEALVDSTWPGSKNAFRLQAPEGGAITSISMYILTAGAQVTFGVYADLGGVPGNLLAKCSPIVTKGNSWETAPISVPIVAGSWYWLADMADRKIDWTYGYYDTSDLAAWGPEASGTLSPSFTQPGFWNARVSVYATYSSAAMFLLQVNAETLDGLTLRVPMAVDGAPFVTPAQFPLDPGQHAIVAPPQVEVPEPGAVNMGAWGIDDSAVLSVMEAGTIFFVDREFTSPLGRTVEAFYFGWGDYAPFYPMNPIRGVDVDAMKANLLSLDLSKFVGLNFLAEEVQVYDIDFEDGMTKDWFGETLLGWNLYGGDYIAWQDEMYTRMLRGFANWAHSHGRLVGTTVSYDFWRYYDPEYFCGVKGWSYVLTHFDYVLIYSYTRSLGDWARTKDYFAHVDQLPTRLLRVSIVTRPWTEEGFGPWEREAIALEMKYFLNRGFYGIVTYTWTSGMDWRQTWADMLRSVELHQAGAPFYEQLIYGTNLLTGYVGNTYGWVQS